MKKVFAILVCVVIALVSVALAISYAISQSDQHLQKQPYIERTATVSYVVDGDTIYLEGGEKVRLVGINTPELGPPAEPGAVEAKEFVENLCPSGTEIGLNVDDLKPTDRYGRTLAVVYIRINGVWTNLNAELLRMGFAEVMYIPPSEFNPYEWAS
ncbi:MAG: thermonuclease family protein [Candidatus Hodarchaeaceae archaeon]|nr:thermonuclease family protein [Candidatus Hodarchaeaceae archaeon]